MVTLHTSHGAIMIELDHDKAPLTADNFLRYVREGFYDGTLFHRVIPNFMIQGGGMLSGMEEKPTRESIRNEADNGLTHRAGTVAMARTSDPHSATAQFFINLNDNDFLNHRAPNAEGWGYAVFGQVVEGMDVVERIVAVPTTSRRGHQDVPVDEVVIERAEASED